jgi:hypothetical protein
MPRAVSLYRGAVLAVVIAAVFVFESAGASDQQSDSARVVAGDNDGPGTLVADTPKPKPKPKHDKDKPDDTNQAGGEAQGASGSFTTTGELGIVDIPAGTQPTQFYVGLVDELARTDAGEDPGRGEARSALSDVLGGRDVVGSSRLEVALTSRGNQDARTEAGVLTRALRDLPSNRAGLKSAVEAYNAFIEASSLAFLQNPPPELSVIHAFLAPLVARATQPSRSTR